VSITENPLPCESGFLLMKPTDRLEASRDADDRATVNNFLRDVLTHAKNVRAAGLVTICLSHEWNWRISAPEDRAAKATGCKLTTGCEGQGDVSITPDKATRVGLAFLGSVARSAANKHLVDSDSLSNFLLREEAGAVSGDNAEHLVLHFRGTADALEKCCAHYKRVREHAKLGKLEFASGNVGRKIERCDVRFAVGGNARDSSQAIRSVCESGNTGLVADLNLAQEHVGNGNLDIEEASEVTLSCIRKNLFQAELGGCECVRNELARHTGICSTWSDLGSVIVQSFGLPKIDLEILAAANVCNVDRHDFSADEKVLAVAPAFVNGLCDVASDCGG